MDMTASIFKEGDLYVAQCLEHDIAAQGPSEPEALGSLIATVHAQWLVDMHHSVVPFSGFGAAPERYAKLGRQQMFTVNI